MVKDILTEAGFVEGETFEETQFINPPRGTYAVYLDSFTRKGADRRNLLKEHDCTIELYSDFPDPDAEARIEAQLDERAIEYDKGDLTWIQAEQLYMRPYYFEFIEK